MHRIISYHLPPDRIAHEPANPRDASRLFVYDTRTDTVSYATFRDLAHFLPSRSCIVLNNTRVMPARVDLTKETGGKVTMLFLVNEPARDGALPAMADREIRVGTVVSASDYSFDVVDQDRHIFFLKPRFDPQKLPYFFDGYGRMPLPHYIESKITKDEERSRYQTIYASGDSKSVAAPTAGLHFTERVFDSLKKHNIDVLTVTLHVGQGTFVPVTHEHFAKGTLHEEPYTISDDVAVELSRARREGRPIVAVGTTSLRVLETAHTHVYSGRGVSGTTNLFIHGDYKFSVVDHLITNFHLPGSSLVLLVDAFLRHKGARRNVTDLYEMAIRDGFRFYSFGDAMLIL